MEHNTKIPRIWEQIVQGAKKKRTIDQGELRTLRRFGTGAIAGSDCRLLFLMRRLEGSNSVVYLSNNLGTMQLANLLNVCLVYNAEITALLV